jgi:hypothetical protein
MPLITQLKNLITQTGTISMAEFMQIVLAHPEYGYYKTQEPFGIKGDFTTSPEISQLFGELIGIWTADIWLQMGSPPDMQLVEIGPGRGTLMDDLLRATKHVPGFHEGISIFMVETSNRLALIQQDKLKHKHPRIKWLENISDIEKQPVIFVANELFDALPAHQYIKQNDQLFEKMLGLNKSGELEFVTIPITSRKSHFSQVISSKMGMQSFQRNMNNPNPWGGGAIPDSAILEISPLAINIMEEICQHIKQHGGAALIIDYGYTKPEFKDTICAILNHKHHGLLEDIGSADLSAHVDFGLLRNVAENIGLSVYGAINQGDFLNNMGIDLRVGNLSKNANEKQIIDLQTAAARLTQEGQMGKLFKALAVTRNIEPAGF